MAVIKEANVPDGRPLIMRLCEYKNTRNVKNAFMPPKTLGMPGEKSANYGKCMAMDRCIRNVLSGFKNDIAFTAAPMFVGYAMLSNVSQEALIRAGVETVADEMTRKLVEWTYDEDDGSKDENKDKILADLETQAVKYKLKERLREGACKDGYFGGCLIYIDVGDLDDVEAEEPLVLDKKTFKKGSLRGFKVIEPINVYPGEYNTSDPTDEHYFNPEYWYVLGKKYHASRFLYMAGNDTPVLLKPAYNFFGIPQAQLALDYVAHFVANRESAQELLNKFSLTCWKTDMTQALQGGSCNDLVSRVKLFNKLKTNNGTMVLNKDTEDMMQINTPLSGVRDIVEMSLNLLTAVWRIPKIKYLGEGEGGLNASSKEQMRSYYDYIMSQKEKLFTQPLETVLKIFQLNLGWDINPAIGFKFPVLWDMDDSERASLNKQQADRDALYLSNGVLSQEEVRRRLSMDRNSDYAMIDVDDVPEPQANPLEGNPDDDPEGPDKGPNGGQKEEPEEAKDSKLAMDENKRAKWHDRFKSMTMDGGKGSGNFGHSGREGKVGGSSNVVDLSNDFEKAPTFQEVKEYVNETIKEGIKFLTGSKDFMIDIPDGQHNKRKIINSNNFQKLNQSGQRRHNKYVMSLSKILKNSNYLGNKENTKKDKKSFVDKYHYFGATVKIGDKLYDLIIDAEQNVGENEIKPQTVHLYNITENDRRYKGLNLDYNPPIVEDIIAQDSENVKDFFKLFDFDDDMAMDDKWITIGHRDAEGDDEGRKGRHILLKEGETPAEAIERTTGTDIDGNGKVGKKDDKPAEKTKEPETKPEPKPEEKKEEPKEEEKKDGNLKESVKDWYKKTFPDDDLGDRIDENVSFEDINKNPGAIYDLLGVGDSLVRERVFQEISGRENKDYNDIYQRWMNKEKSEEPKPEPVRETTPAMEYGELLEKEQKGELTDAEKARKKELEDKHGFGEKEVKLEDMTDEELEAKNKELDDQYKDLMQRRKDALKKAKEEDKELNDLQKEYDELQQKSYKVDYYTDEGHEISHKMDEINEKINKRRDDIFDDVNSKFDKEYNELSEKIHPVQMEKYNREKKKEEVSLNKRNGFMDKFTGIMTKSDDMSDEDFISAIKSIEEEVRGSDMSDNDKEVALKQISTRSGQVVFNKRADSMGKKVKEYSKTTDALVKEFETFDDPYEKWSKEREAARMKLIEMRDERDKEQDPEKKKKLESAITMQILQSHFSVDTDDLNKVKYDRTMAVANILRKQKNTGSKVVEGKSTIKGLYDKLNGVLGGVIGKDIKTDDAPKVQAMRAGSRAYYSSRDNMFKVEKEADFGDVIHEYTHFLERNNSKMLANSLAFAEYRTKGENYERLSKLTGSNGYKGNEIAKKDSFFSPYCGKIYSQDQEYRTASASEIMSMGVERLFREPAKFAKEDREYFDFVVANLRGEI